MIIKRAEDLRIYKTAIQLAEKIFQLTKGIPFYWNSADVKQILRSSLSVPSNIAEGFSQRFYPRQFIHYLNIALGSSDETQNHLRLLYGKTYISKEQNNHYLNQYKNLSIKILNLICYLKEKYNIKL